MESQDGLIGRLLGTCLLERMIGTGGMGAVYLAKQIRPVREVAIKVLQSGMLVRSSEHQAFLARFRREANVIAQLDHINIMPIYEYGEQDEYAYLVMPYLTGGSLLERLREQNILEPEEALTYVEQVASALHYAHQRKIVHRDVKPGNILFHSDGRLVLADFGIARILRSEEEGDTALTSEQQIVGSVEYMAPEMVAGKDVDHRADIYELGVVLFQMLTGRLPFQGRSALEIAVKHIEEPFPSAMEFNPQLSAAIGIVVARATARRPDERYQSTLEMVQALREAIERDKNQGWSRSAYATTPGWATQETRITPSPSSPGTAQIAATDYSSRLVRNNNESPAYPLSSQSRNIPVSQLNGTQPGAEQQIYHTDIAHIANRVSAKKSAVASVGDSLFVIDRSGYWCLSKVSTAYRIIVRRECNASSRNPASRNLCARWRHTRILHTRSHLALDTPGQPHRRSRSASRKFFTAILSIHQPERLS